MRPNPNPDPLTELQAVFLAIAQRLADELAPVLVAAANVVYDAIPAEVRELPPEDFAEVAREAAELL